MTSPWRCWFPKVANALTVVSVAAMWLYVVNDTFYYFAGSSLREAVISLFSVCLFVQFARAVAPGLLRLRSSPVPLVLASICVILLAVMINYGLEQFTKRDLRRFRSDRIAYSGESNDGVIRAFTDRDFYYPPESFLAEARRTIPEGEAVLYLGNIRPDPVNYALYPRPVYAIPALQRAALASAIYSWSDDEDPALPDGFAPWLQDAQVDREAISRETLDLIRDRDIRWAVIVDAFDESQNRVLRLGEVE